MTTTRHRQVMTHIILLAPKVETQDEALEQLFQEVGELHKDIPGLISATAGENNSTGHRGFTHGIIMRFSKEISLQDAFRHPAYQGLREEVARLCEQVITFDLPELLPLPASPATPELAEPALPEAPIVLPKQQKRSKAKQSVASKVTTPPSTDFPLLRRDQRRSRRLGRTEIDPRLVKMMVDQLQVEEKAVLPTASLVLDLNADSLDLVELIMSVEEVFHIQIPDEDAARLTTVGEIQEYLIERNVL